MSNLIENGGFEQWTPGAVPALVFKPSGPPALFTTGNLPAPMGWVVWFRHGDFAVVRYDQPETKPMRAEAGYQARIHSGTRSACMFGFQRRFSGGFYQIIDVPGHGPATIWLWAETLWAFKHNDAYWDSVEARVVDGVLAVTAWAHAWSNHDDRVRVPGHEECCDDARCSWGVGREVVAIAEGEAPPLNGDPWNDAIGNFTFKVGVSLTASLDPRDATWGQGKHTYNGFAPVTVSVPLHSPPLPPTPPLPDSMTPTPYERTYLLLPPGASKRWARYAVAAVWDDKRWTIGGSADDAGIGEPGVTLSRRVIAVNPSKWQKRPGAYSLRDFFAEFYPGVEYVEIVASTPRQLGQILGEM